MTTNTLAAATSQRLIDNGVTIIALPGGSVQLLGKYGSILLTQDITTLQPKQIEQLSGVCVPLAGGSGTAVHPVLATPRAADDQDQGQSHTPNILEASWYEP